MNPQFNSYVPQAPVKRSQPKLSPRTLMIIIGGIVLVIIAVGLLMLNNLNSPTAQMNRLYARLDALDSLLTLGNKNVKNDSLSKVQSDARLLLSGDISSIQSALAKNGVKAASKDAVALETDTSTTTMLNDAAVNGRFDPAYKTALSQKLESTMALMQELNTKTKNKPLKESLATAYSHCGSLLDQLSKVSV